LSSIGWLDGNAAMSATTAGSFTRTFAHYEAMPEEVARSIEPRDHH